MRDKVSAMSGVSGELEKKAFLGMDSFEVYKCLDTENRNNVINAMKAVYEVDIDHAVGLAILCITRKNTPPIPLLHPIRPKNHRKHL